VGAVYACKLNVSMDRLDRLSVWEGLSEARAVSPKKQHNHGVVVDFDSQKQHSGEKGKGSFHR